MNDFEIIELLFARDEQGLTALSQSYGTRLQHLSQNILRNEEDAEECLNDTLMTAWRKIPPERPDCLFAWLAQVLKRLSFDRLRYRNADCRNAELVELTRELEECLPGEEGSDAAEGLTETVSEFLRGCDYRTRFLFVRRYWYLDSVRELAATCGEPEGTIRSRLSRTRKKLMKYLESEGYHL